MDGDFAPLKELAALRKKHGFLLIIDEVCLHPAVGLYSSSHCANLNDDARK